MSIQPQCPRVLQVVLSLNPGGTERLVIDLIAALSPSVPIALCCLDEKGAWSGQVERLGVPVRALNRRSGFHPSLGRAIASVATRVGANIVHCHHYSPFIYGCIARVMNPRLRLIYTEHGRLSDAPASRKRLVANRLLARFPTQVFAVSEDLKRQMVREGFAAARIGVIYNGITVGPVPGSGERERIRAKLDVSDDTLVVGTVARLDPVKDLDTAIAAMTRFSRTRRCLLLIIGDGSERIRLEHAVRQSGIGAAVRFLGHRDDARDWLAGCDVYMNSSISEGISLTILEAMAARLPVVATRVGGTPEIVTSECGRLVPPRDPDALAAALEDLARATVRTAMGSAARRVVESRFTIGRMVEEYRAVYRSVTGSSR